MVVYDIGDGAEGVFLSQEELPGVGNFDLVMPDVPVSTAGTHRAKMSVHRGRSLCL